MNIIKPQSKNDSTSLGAIMGLILPIIGMALFIIIAGNRFDSYKDAIMHFHKFNVLYKALSLALMPSAGLFFLWTNMGKINQARGILLMTLFYGIFVIVLFMF
jgi:hypothetical protein